MTRGYRVEEVRWGPAVAVLIAALGAWAGSPAESGVCEWTIAGYLSGDGDLAVEAERYLELISSGAETAGWNAAVQIDRGGPGGSCLAARHLSLGGEAGRYRATEPVPGWQMGVNMGDGATLEGFLGWVREVAPAEHYALIVMGHGIGVGGDGGRLHGGLVDSGVALDASSGGDTLSAAELREAVRAAGPDQGCWLDALFLDCCFSGSLEVAYELRTIARWLCGAPGQMASPGVQWDAVLRLAGAQGTEDGGELVRTCLAVGSAGGGGQVGLTGIDLSRVAAVAVALRALSAAAVPRMAELAPSVTWARSGSRAWGDGRELCDVRQFSARLGQVAPSAQVREAAGAVADAVAMCLVAGGDGDEGGGGLAVFLPGLLGELPTDYTNGALGLAREGGWGEFVGAYVDRLRELMRQAATGRDDAGGPPAG